MLLSKLRRKMTYSHHQSQTRTLVKTLFTTHHAHAKQKHWHNPDAGTEIIPGIIVNQSGHAQGAPLVDLQCQYKQNQLLCSICIIKSGTGAPGSYWGLRITPQHTDKLPGKLLRFSLDILPQENLSLPGMVIKICDGKSCTERYIDTQRKQSITVFHVQHPQAKELYIDINLGEWHATKLSSLGTVSLKNFLLEVEQVSELTQNCIQHFTQGDHNFDYNTEKFSYDFYLDKISLSFPEKIHCFLKHNPEHKLLATLIDSDSLAIDAGANWGIYSVLMAKYAKSVWAFEPNPMVYPFFVRNLSSFQHAHCFSSALGEQHKTVELCLKKSILDPILDSGGGSIESKEIATLGKEHYHRYQVPQFPLDALVPKRVSFIKIDVEGAELSLLRGALSVIKKHQTSMLIEITDKWNNDAHNTITFLHELGYEIFYFCKPDQKYYNIKRFSFTPYYEYFSAYPKKLSLFNYVENFVCIHNNHRHAQMFLDNALKISPNS